MVRTNLLAVHISYI